MELVGICSHVAGSEAVILKTFVLDAACPDKNEDYADHKEHVRQIRLFKGQLEHF